MQSVDVDRNFQSINDGYKIEAGPNQTDTVGLQLQKAKLNSIAHGAGESANMQAVKRVKNDLRKLI